MNFDKKMTYSILLAGCQCVLHGVDSWSLGVRGCINVQASLKAAAVIRKPLVDMEVILLATDYIPNGKPFHEPSTADTRVVLL